MSESITVDTRVNLKIYSEEHKRIVEVPASVVYWIVTNINESLLKSMADKTAIMSDTIGKLSERLALQAEILSRRAEK